MSDQSNPNQLISDILSKLAIQFVEKTSKHFSSSEKRVTRYTLQTVIDMYKRYLQREYEARYKTKTLLYKDSPEPIASFYVDPDLEHAGDSYDSAVFDAFTLGNHIVLSGTAGSGKSMFMKSLFVKMIEKSGHGFPFFVDLRNLNSTKEDDILNYLLKSLKTSNKHIDRNYLEKTLKAGFATLLLDGLDEVDGELRHAIDEQILYLASTYPDCRIIVSTRPDPSTDHWDTFRLLRIMAFTKQKAIELIGKLRYDDVVKEKFTSQIDSGLYETHRSFLSNPLLLTMMLLTYESMAEIPTRLHIYYEQAFETLYYRHDATKELYKREFKSNLAIDDFKRVLSAFAFISYSKSAYNMTRPSALEYLNQARELTGVQFSPTHVLEDLLTSVCILVRDGLYITYSHRSFQEYFAAVFLYTHTTSDRFLLIDHVARRTFNDNVLNILYDIDAAFLEAVYILPMIDNISGKVDKLTGGVYKYMRIFSLFIDSIQVDNVGGRPMFSTPDLSLYYFWAIIEQIYQTDSMFRYFSDIDFRPAFAAYASQAGISNDGDPDPYSEIRILPPTKIKHKLFSDISMPETSKHIMNTLTQIGNRLRRRSVETDRNMLAILGL